MFLSYPLRQTDHFNNATLINGELVRHNLERKCRVLLASVLSLSSLLQIDRRSFLSQDPCLMISDRSLKIGESDHGLSPTEITLQTSQLKDRFLHNHWPTSHSSFKPKAIDQNARAGALLIARETSCKAKRSGMIIEN